jgi:apolipoprotein N-acyltransferase
MAEKRGKKKTPKKPTTRKEKPGGGEAATAGAAAVAAPRPIWLPLGLGVFSAVISFLAFPGFDVRPLAFVCLVPLFFAMDVEPRMTSKQAAIVAMAFGFVGMWGGYYWVVTMLQDFSGFGLPLCILFASLLHLFQGGMLGLFAWLYFRLKGVGVPTLLAVVIAHPAAEMVYPMLFPYYYGNHLHDLPILIQIADLGGPMLVTALVGVINAGVYEAIRPFVRKEKWQWKQPAIAAGALLFALGYGAYRIAEVDARAAASPAVTVAMPQVSMGIFDKREDPWEGLRRHITMSRELERTVHPDLLVWPESAYTFFLPDGAENVRREVMGPLTTPLLFGGLQRRQLADREHHYNTAFMVDGEGNVLGTYDKTFLLAFGEYLPFGETFPVLYDWSPHSGRFTPGDHVRPLEWNGYRLSTLICYEDIIPRFVNRAVAESDPHLLVNVSNDAWFGRTNEPWQHLALAKFRAVEHHRYLVRSTNSGVSAIIDPVGRTVGETGVFTTESLSGEVRMMTGWTLYQTLGDWPGYLSIALVLWLAFIRPRLKRRSGGTPLK